MRGGCPYIFMFISPSHLNFSFMQEYLKQKNREFLADTQGLTGGYRDLYLANPWATMTAEGGFLGIGRRRDQQQLDIKAAEYDANLAQQMYQEQYNSPEAQAERLKAAGINPDLAGGLSAGEAAGTPVSGSELQLSDPSKQMSDISGTLLNIAALAMSFPEGLAAIGTEKLAQGFQIAQAGKTLAESFPVEQTDISPLGSALAPVLVDSTVPASKIVETIPNLSGIQKRKLAQSIEVNRRSLKSTLSGARDRQALFNLLNSPELSMPQIAKECLELESKLSLVKLKGALKEQEAFARFADENAKKAADNEKRKLEVEGEELEARSASASADQAEATMRRAEANTRTVIAVNTDGKQIGITRSQQAELQGIQAETAKEQLDIIEGAEDSGIFGTSLVGDVLSYSLRPMPFHEKVAEVFTRSKIRRSAKRANKRYYKQSAKDGRFSIGPSGVSYSE